MAEVLDSGLVNLAVWTGSRDLDSAVALAAWMLDHDADSYHKASRASSTRSPLRPAHPGRDRRQHHPVLAGGHRGIGGAE